MGQSEKNKAENARKALSGRVKLIIILTVITLLLVGGVYARYVWQSQSDNADVTSDPFYFTIDLLGDSKMNSNENGEFSFDKTIKGVWHLYGGGEHKVNFSLQNYYDDLRVTQNVIKYGVTVDNGGIANVTLTDNGTNSMIANSLTLGVEPTNTSASKFEKADQAFCLTIPSGYKEKATVKVTIESTSPYIKTIELSFEVYPIGLGLTYEVVDSVNSPYAELIIRNGTNSSVQPKIVWPVATLSIDNTNELTFNSDFSAQTGMEDGEMTISRALKPNESVSIYFFKSDNKNYSMAKTTATINQEGDPSTYMITIKNPA